MQIHEGSADFPSIKVPVVTSGTFDGVHIGHQKILERIHEIALREGGETVLLTYWPHPRMVLNPNDDTLRLLSTFEEKAELLAENGIHHLVKIPFTREFAQTTSEQFIRQVIVEDIGTQKLVIGYDHRFGRNREGSFEALKADAPTYGFTVEEIPRQDIDDVGVSSTKIRKALEDGDVGLAREYLGRPYDMRGIVVKGDQLGRTLGFPTANLDLQSPQKLIPADGIYAVHVHHGNTRLHGMLYIGPRPTINGQHRRIEVNLFDFSGDLYGETLKVEFIARTRGDEKLDGLEALKARLGQDEVETRAILEK
ncbi:MAG TPA: riboflavin biosynthesis protein RibF [Cytophagales bacterium]|nr:riboflavin biosynthesis protein RibF [Cytophagales bacterium]